MTPRDYTRARRDSGFIREVVSVRLHPITVRRLRLEAKRRKMTRSGYVEYLIEKDTSP